MSLSQEGDDGIKYPPGITEEGKILAMIYVAGNRALVASGGHFTQVTFKPTTKEILAIEDVEPKRP